MNKTALTVVGVAFALTTFVDFANLVMSIVADGLISAGAFYYLWNQLPKKEAADKKVPTL